MIRRLIKRWRCHHDMQLVRWHWTHGFDGNKPVIIEVEWKCSKCGMISYSYPRRSEWMYYLMEEQKNARDDSDW